MKIVFLCGYFSEADGQEVEQHAKGAVEYSANLFQKKLIRGLEQNGLDFEVFSAPFIGSYPNASDVFYFKGFSNTKQESSQVLRTVPFLNVFGLRNFSRAHHLKRALEDFIRSDDPQKQIIIYSPHTPFLSAAVYAKKRDPSIRISLVVPDLPQYMNLNAHKSLIYRLGKKYDIFDFNRLNRYMDSYLFLTQAMTEKISIHNSPYMVVEGLVTEEELEKSRQMRQPADQDTQIKNIVYTGKLNEKFGVKHLVDAFLRLPNEDYRLILCGKGDAEEYISKKMQQDRRICCLGQVSPKVAQSWLYKASVLVNPRRNDEVYTKYSFPSKTIEYLLTGNPVVANLLDGMPKEYQNFLITPDSDKDAVEALFEAIEVALNQPRCCSRLPFEKYAEERLVVTRVVARLIAPENEN